MTGLLLPEHHANALFEHGVSRQFERELRCSHAGETGAVWIYRGVLATRPSGELRHFAEEHLATEQAHLALFDQLTLCYRPSLLLPLWRIAGFLTGFLPALAGSRAVFATIAAVETFVDEHYREQIADLNAAITRQSDREILERMERCRLDEVAHRDDAASRETNTRSRLLSVWTQLVGIGSNAAVSLARHL